jgi:hypothetical protein
MRSLTSEEKLWVQRALQEEPDLQGQDITNFLSQVDSLKVQGRCPCDDPQCRSVRFQHYRPGFSYGLADAVINKGTANEFRVILFADHETGLLTEIEVL